jgi:cytochrome c oxidase subunit 2
MHADEYSLWRGIKAALMKGGETILEETTATPAKKGGINPVLIAVIVIIVLAGLGYMMMKSNTSTTSQTTPAPTEAVNMNDGATAAPTAEAPTGTDSGAMTDGQTADVKTVNIEAGSFYYKPNEIRVKKGQKVKIVMKAVSMMHDFNIDELNVKMPIVKNGETGTVEFTPDQTGTFEYYCGVGQHRKNGQVGTIIVE